MSPPLASIRRKPRRCKRSSRKFVPAAVSPCSWSISRLNQENGQSILLVEQNTQRALELADRAYVLELGRVTMEGAPDHILADRALQAAYLGRGRGDDRGDARTTSLN